MFTSVNPLARVFAVMAIVGSVMFACGKSDVNPTDLASSARTAVNTDSTSKDTLCHKGDSTRPHRRHDHPASLHHHSDSLMHPHPDSVAHDSTHHRKHRKGKGH